MAALPDDYALASGYAAVRAAEVWELLRDVENWPRVFPGWIERIEAEDERFTATGPSREKFDLYPHPDAEHRALDVETVDELGSSDTLRLRVLDVPSGSLVVAAHGRLQGTADAAWNQKREAIAAGLDAIAGLL
ncbi:MAG: SRPBCC family protein [Solirubrobacterales bacterium]